MDGAQPSAVMAGDRLQITWPAPASWSELEVRCVLVDGSRHAGGRWISHGAGRFRADCGPVLTDLAVAMVDERVQLTLGAAAPPETSVCEVALVGHIDLGRGGFPAWVIRGGYQSWDPAEQAAVAGSEEHFPSGGQESWWTVGLADERGAGLAAAAVRAHVSCTRFAVMNGDLTVSWSQPNVRDQAR